ncbi:MAG: acyl-ACP--UDP-N-acetylglucosamine O-acyltransferase [Burkholderiales bacterium]|nr:MAG: acyl-ACP--UDP-N-acetylglucosamine O-acyltransferase [Burkholderiales bacterium]
MARIHPTAIVASSAELASDVEVGPFSTVGEHVRIGAGSKLVSHVVIDGHTTIGERNTFFPFSSIGLAPQDKKYAGEPTRVVIGNDNVFRESCTIHRGTAQDNGVTTLGSRILVMAYAHVAHDCLVGDDVILANAATLAGHVQVGAFAIIGGLAGVHQFCRVGQHAMIGGCACVTQDVAPYVLGHGNPFSVSSVNLEGLKRRGFDADAVAAVRDAHKIVWRSGHVLAEARVHLLALHDASSASAQAALKPLIDFLAVSGRGLAR